MTKNKYYEYKGKDYLPEPLLLLIGWIGMIFCYPFIRKRILIEDKLTKVKE